MLLQELAQSLQARGHEVAVLTGFPNYPSGAIYPGYALRLRQRETLAGVPVVRVPLYPEHSRSGVRRALNYISFALSAIVLGPWLAPRPDVIFVYHPPLTIGIPAYVLSRLWRVPFVYQIQDMWPETLNATGMFNNKRLLGWIGRFAKWVYAKAQAILVISPGFSGTWWTRACRPKRSTSSRTGSILKPTIGRRRSRNWLRSSTWLGGSTSCSPATWARPRGLRRSSRRPSCFRMTRTCSSSWSATASLCRGLQQLAQDQHLANVRFLGRYPAQEMPRLYALADVLLVHFTR